MDIKTEQFVQVAEEELKNERTRLFLSLLPPAVSQRRQAAMSTFSDPKAAMSYCASVRGAAVDNLPDLLEEFEKNATANGAKVIWARDAAEANEFVVQKAREKGVSYVTKGKSMVTEELGLNPVLEQNGIEAFETDLGEYIAQQLKRPPFHIVGPAINVPPEEIRDLFMDIGILEKATADPVELGLAARIYLRDKFHHLKMGITGINMAIADTGSVINVENEGNIRFTKAAPQTQISIMSIEKVIPSIKDAMFQVRLLCRSCTGQKISSYVTIDNGPKKNDEIDGPEELYIVIVDNGRSAKYHDLLAREALRCFRCGACLNICPVYTTVGGYPYGWAYSGPMGQVLNPMLLGQERTQDLYRASTLCGACKEVCPTGVNHPKIFRYYRSKDVDGDTEFGGKPRPLMESIIYKFWLQGVTNSWSWKLGARLARPLLNNAIKNGWLRKKIKPLDNWLQARDLPLFPKKTFRDRWKDLRDRS